MLLLKKHVKDWFYCNHLNLKYCTNCVQYFCNFVASLYCATFSHICTSLYYRFSLPLPRRHMAQTEHTYDVQKTSWTSSESLISLMYVQFTSCICGYCPQHCPHFQHHSLHAEYLQLLCKSKQKVFHKPSLKKNINPLLCNVVNYSDTL